MSIDLNKYVMLFTILSYTQTYTHKTNTYITSVTNDLGLSLSKSKIGKAIPVIGREGP
jgi:hypothetical protein